jgi:hypothetical protein
MLPLVFLFGAGLLPFQRPNYIEINTLRSYDFQDSRHQTISIAGAVNSEVA